VTQYVPPGWPAGVHPPGSEEFERSAIAWVLTAYRNEGQRLAAAAQAAELIERALHGEVFVRQTSGGARSVARDPGAHRKPDATGTP
jgi:hypothetical protein